MIKFSLNQIKFLSTTSLLLLSWQSLAIAGTNLNNKVNQKQDTLQIAQALDNQDVLVPNPTIKIDGKPVNNSQSAPPPFLPRAVAPPVGDMSVSNINTNISPMINLGSNGLTIVPRLVLRDAPANEVLALLARAADLNIVFVDQNQEGQNNNPDQNQNIGNTISLDLVNQPVQEVFNNVLILAGLQASQRGNTIIVGEKLPSMARNLITRSIRLNQASPEGAANFLATQGAEVAIVFTPIEREFNQETGAVVRELQGITELRPVKVAQSAETRSALPLTGLQVTTDDRTGTINLVGEPHLIRMATSFLTQLDIRRRQVAVNVKVIDVQLDQAESFGASFSFGIDDTGIVQDGGVGVINFGTNNGNVDGQQFRVDDNGNLIPAFDEQIIFTENFASDLANSLTNTISDETNSSLSDTVTQDFEDTINRTLSQFGNQTAFSRDQVESIQRALIEDVTRTIGNSNISEVTNDVINSVGRNVTRTLQGLPLGTPNSGQISPFGTDADPLNPGTAASIRPGTNFNVPQAFLAQIRANVNSGNAKILTDPTLVVQEGQIGAVELVENVVTSVETEVDTESGVRTTTPIIEPAGLTLNVEIDKIDDNGFISLRVNPNVSAPGTPQIFASGDGANNVITPLVERTVSSGLIRLRDGQTLILSGIISDGERTTVSKIPILGDLPLIGSLFRSTFKDRARSEVIVILTPQILDDSDAYSGSGYNYTPSRETGNYLRDRGLNLPTTPY